MIGIVGSRARLHGYSFPAPAVGSGPTAPPAGFFKNINNNTLADVDPCPLNNCIYSGTGTESLFTVWGGCAITPDGIVVWSGGHLSWSGNVAFYFRFSTGTWSYVGTPSPYTETDADSAGKFPDGRYFVGHSYTGLAYLAPEHGGGPLGSMICFGFAGASVTQSAFKVDLATGTHSNFAALAGFGGSYFSNVWDASRQRYWLITGYSSYFTGHGYVTTDGTVTILNNLGGNVDGADHALSRSVNHDMLVQFGIAGGVRKLYGRLCSGSAAFSELTMTGSPPNPINGFTYCPDNGKFYCFEGNTSGQSTLTLHALTPPASSLFINPWAWSTQTITGMGGAVTFVANYQSGFNGIRGRLPWVADKHCFAFTDGKNNPVAFITPSDL